MSNQVDKYENLEICKQCGGYCCKKSGCDYFVSDLQSMKLNYIESLLDTGRVSIIASFDFRRLNSGKLIYEIILSLRARNKNRDAIDLFSFKTECASLTANGCYYDINTRPSGGSALIPCINEPCYSKIDRLEELKKWKPYQKVLEKIVKRRTNMSVTQKIKQDVENLIYNILTENFKDSARAELEDIAGMIPLLKECFPNEFINAELRYKKSFNHQLLARKK